MFQLNYDVQQQLLLSSSSSTSKLSLANEDKFAAVQKQFFKKLQQNFEIVRASSKFAMSSETQFKTTREGYNYYSISSNAIVCLKLSEVLQ